MSASCRRCSSSTTRRRALGNNGSIANPFNSIASFNSNAADGSGDYVYINAGTYSEADGINLVAGEHLFGQGQTLQFTNPVTGQVVTIGTGSSGATPTISVTGNNQHGIDLAANNEVNGLNVATTRGNQIGIHDSGASVGSLTMNDIDVTGVGQAVNISHGGALTVAHRHPDFHRFVRERHPARRHRRGADRHLLRRHRRQRRHQQHLRLDRRGLPGRRRRRRRRHRRRGHDHLRRRHHRFERCGRRQYPGSRDRRRHAVRQPDPQRQSAPASSSTTTPAISRSRARTTASPPAPRTRSTSPTRPATAPLPSPAPFSTSTPRPAPASISAAPTGATPLQLHRRHAHHRRQQHRQRLRRHRRRHRQRHRHRQPHRQQSAAPRSTSPTPRSARATSRSTTSAPMAAANGILLNNTGSTVA